jgi:hypothetical protein
MAVGGTCLFVCLVVVLKKSGAQMVKVQSVRNEQMVDSSAARKADANLQSIAQSQRGTLVHQY